MTTHSKLPRIVLVDDHPAVLRQTALLLSGDFEIIARLENGQDLLTLAGRVAIDVIVLDITLPGVSGIELAAHLKKMGCSAKIVFLTVHADPDYVREAFDAGGLGYVVKPRLASDIIPAVRDALAGRRYISACPELADVA